MSYDPDMKSQKEDKAERKAQFLALFDQLDGTKAARVAQVAEAAGVRAQTVRRWCMLSSQSDRAPCRLALDAIQNIEEKHERS